MTRRGKCNGRSEARCGSPAAAGSFGAPVVADEMSGGKSCPLGLWVKPGRRTVWHADGSACGRVGRFGVKLPVASFNVENLFGRAKVFAQSPDLDTGDTLLELIDEFRELVEKDK